MKSERQKETLKTGWMEEMAVTATPAFWFPAREIREENPVREVPASRKNS